MRSAQFAWSRFSISSDDGAAERAAVADAAPDLRAVGLDLHPPAAAVPELAPREVAVDVVRSELEPGGQPLDHGHEAGAVRLAGRREAQGRHLQQATFPACRTRPRVWTTG